jgi:hypothetical protein
MFLVKIWSQGVENHNVIISGNNMNNFIIYVRQYYNRPLMNHNFKKTLFMWKLTLDYNI